MLIPNHPEDERLSALASAEADAIADAALVTHVTSCDRCTALVDELGALRVFLADLPDLKPSRPLRLLPEVVDDRSPEDRVGGWARRFFGPVLAAGAAVAMVGLVGTTAPIFDSMASGGAAPQSSAMELDAAGGDGDAPAAAASDAGTAEGAESDTGRMEAAASDEAEGQAFSAEDGNGRDLSDQQPVGDDRPLWPMLLFAGVAVMVGAGLMRWIFVPRPES